MTKMNRSHPKLKKTRRAAKRRSPNEASYARMHRRIAKRGRILREQDAVLHGFTVPGFLLAKSKVRGR